MLLYPILFFILCSINCNAFLKKYTSNFVYKSPLYFTSMSKMLVYNPTYTLIWRECNECKQLLNDIKDANIRILYVDGTYYFSQEIDSPFLYKDDKLVAITVFDIYETLFV